MRIRSRLALLLIVPLVGLLAVAGYQVVNASQQSLDASRLSAGADLSLASYRLIDALQAERQLLAADQPVTTASRGAVKTAQSRVKALSGAEGGTLRVLVALALERVDAAGALAATNTGGIVAVDGYSPAINDLLAVSRAGFDPRGAIDDGPATATDFLATAQEAGAHERDLITALAGDQGLVPTQYQKVTSLASEQQILAGEASGVANPALKVRIDRMGDSLAAAGRGRDQLFFATPERATIDEWLATADARVDALNGLRNDAATAAVAAVGDLATSSRLVLILSALGVIATLLISGLLVRSATRSIARPLQDLAAQAEEVALSRLPDAVRAQQEVGGDVHLPAVRATGAAEVREVAGAFNDVQDTALRLAGEQAVLRRNLSDALTNLGRRNQALLGRQLDFISSLEKRETDPAFLDHLFRLDHLASRMRRNAESLLILAGSETPRRRRKPAVISEIVRASMSEVEDFERVRLGHLGDATLTGPVVIDLVHLLAELIENALTFSPPDSTVEIDGRSLGQGGYQLAVIDHGVGMSNVEVVAANHRLAGMDEVDGMPTRYLGQYVIAKLANKTGAIVRLQPTAGGRGVTAVVSLPATAMVGGADRSGVAQPLPGSRAARDQGPTPFAPGAGIAAPIDQPDPVIDPSADPFADPIPTMDELDLVDPTFRSAAATGNWSWTPEVPELDVRNEDDGPVGHPVAPVDIPWFDAVAEPSVSPDPPAEPLTVPVEFDAPAFEAAFEAPAHGPVEPTSLLWAPPIDVPAPPVNVGPPPPPPTIVQQDWLASGRERDVDPAAAPAPAPAPAPALSPLPPVVATPAAFDGPFPTAPADEVAPGGLTKRVPGASLSESPLGEPSAASTPTRDRSADGVRSMLSSFQTGRVRGRDGSVALEEPVRDGPPSSHAPGTTEHMSAPPAPELEDPRDH